MVLIWSLSFLGSGDIHLLVMLLMLNFQQKIDQFMSESTPASRTREGADDAIFIWLRGEKRRQFGKPVTAIQIQTVNNVWKQRT